MKKVISIALAILMAISVISLVGCSDKPQGDAGADEAVALKFGMGIYTKYAKATDATEEADGEGEYTADVAAVLVDAEGKIVKCVIDCADNKVGYTTEGKLVKAADFKTKKELGADYNMVAYGGATKEWFEQADALAGVVEGKTIDEVKALVAEEGKGTDEVINAGCTIAVADMLKAVEKAVANAVESDAVAENTLKIGVVSSADKSSKDATEEADGVFGVVTTVVAVALDAENKVVASSADELVANFNFDTKGVAKTDVTAEIKTKNELGADYGMAAYGQDLNGDDVVKEWNEQADAFEAALKGKTATEIGALANDKGYGTDELQTAGCTINIFSVVAAAVKAATVA